LGKVCDSGIAFYYHIYGYIEFNELMLRRILRFYSLFVAAICLIMMISYLVGYNVVDGRVSISFLGVRKDENYLAAFLCPGYVYLLYSFLFSKKQRAWILILAVLIFLAIFLSGSRAALLTISALSLLMILKIFFAKGRIVRKIIILLLLVLAVVVGYSALQNTSLFTRMTSAGSYTDNIRLKIWGYAMKAYTSKPLFGSGIESGTYYVQLTLRWYTHSVFVDILTGQGLIGAALYLVLFIDLLRVKKENRMYMTVILLAFFVPMFFINGYESATFWLPLIICKAISDYCKSSNKSIMFYQDTVTEVIDENRCCDISSC
jgi:O-antigen ligase